MNVLCSLKDRLFVGLQQSLLKYSLSHRIYSSEQTLQLLLDWFFLKELSCLSWKLLYQLSDADAAVERKREWITIKRNNIIYCNYDVIYLLHLRTCVCSYFNAHLIIRWRGFWGSRVTKAFLALSRRWRRRGDWRREWALRWVSSISSVHKSEMLANLFRSDRRRILRLDQKKAMIEKAKGNSERLSDSLLIDWVSD